ncbi:MAG: dynamin family protein [Nitrospira sp.]|jgi:GTPase Era involved in 16S rRNA processing|nr:dynamin family protein [Nitrospira sp.]
MNNLEQLVTLSRQIGIEAQLPTGDLVCAFVGEWNAGKSSLLNAMTGVGLPARPTSTTRTLVRLSRAITDEATASVTNSDGEQTTFSGPAAMDVLQRSMEHLTEITLQAPGLDIPPGVVFVDTPGFNDQDQIASTRAETVQADVVVFVLQAIGSVINQTQMDFINQVLLTKGSLEDILFVVTHADLLDHPGERDEIAARYRSLFGDQAADRLFLVSMPDQGGVAAFKQRLYDHVNERLPHLLLDRRQRLGKQLSVKMRQEVERRRALLAVQRDQSAEEIHKLEEQITVARQREREQRQELRDNYRNRLRATERQINDAADRTIDLIERQILGMSLERLQAKGEVERIFEDTLQGDFKTEVDKHLQEFMKSLQTDVDGAQRFSSDLLRGLSINLPSYDSPLVKISAEHLLPIAAIGSIALFGWFSIPTLVMGYLALKARDMGLTRADRTGIFDKILNSVQDMTRGAYRQAVGMAVARAITGYRDQVLDYLQQTVSTVTERALAQINGVETLEHSYWQLRNSTDRVEQEALLDQISYALTASGINQTA